MRLKTDFDPSLIGSRPPRVKSVFQLMWKDAARLHDVSGSPKRLSRLRAVVLAFYPELFALVLFRWAHYFYSRGCHWLANFLYRVNLTITAADISPDSNIGGGCLIVHTVGIVIDADIGENCTFFAHVIVERDYAAGKWSERPRLGNNVVVNTAASILGDVYVTDRVVVGPYSLVLESIEHPDCTVSDIPGKKRITSRNIKAVC
jgi:serine O-acetyltransferase